MMGKRGLFRKGTGSAGQTSGAGQAGGAGHSVVMGSQDGVFDNIFTNVFLPKSKKGKVRQALSKTR